MAIIHGNHGNNATPRIVVEVEETTESFHYRVSAESIEIDLFNHECSFIWSDLGTQICSPTQILSHLLELSNDLNVDTIVINIKSKKRKT